MSKYHRPPKWPDRFLQWFCRSELFEFIQGDIYELYAERLQKKGKRYADTAFCWDVVRFSRLSNLQRPYVFNHTIMIRNYLKVGFRNLKKNWSHSLINVSGLTLSVGCAITTFIFADFFFHLNSIHQNVDRIYQVVSHIEEQDQPALYGPSPLIMAEKILADAPSVQEVVRIQYKSGNVKYGANVFRERVQFADPSYFNVFDFPLIDGDSQRFAQGEVFINSEMAQKYFANEEPVGQRMDIKFGNTKRSFTVGGVFGSVPLNTTFHPKILLNFDTYLALTEAETNWENEAKATFVLLEKNTPLAILEDLFSSYATTQRQVNPNQPVSAFELFTFQEVSEMGDIQDRIVPGNDRSGVFGILFSGILLIVFACLNYINIAISSSTSRLKEIGVRKVMGGTRGAIAQQFLIENFLICTIALVLGIAACYFFLLPGFGTMASFVFPFSFSSVSNAILYCLGLFLFLGLLSGAYPAIYISKFESLKIFKGERSLGGKSYFSRVLLTVQFTLVFVTILGSLVFTDNARYVKEKSWGYEPAGVLSLPLSEPVLAERLETQAAAHPAIQSFAASKGHMGVNNALVSFEYRSQPMKALTYTVDDEYLPLMGLPLKEGRFFEKDEQKRSVIVNELFVKQMGWERPIGQAFEFEGSRRTVVGVVADVYHVFFDRDIQRPMVFSFGVDQPNFFVVKAAPADLVAVDEYLKGQWAEVAPFEPYVSIFQADSFDRDYRNVDANIWFMSALAAFTIFLSCLGLYGLLAFTLNNRLKEFSIRKVLGASGKNIVLLANREFIWIMVISFGIGAPLGTVLMQQFVHQLFTVSKPLGIVPVLLGLGITITTILISVSGQMRKVTRVNPVKVLRGE